MTYIDNYDVLPKKQKTWLENSSIFVMIQKSTHKKNSGYLRGTIKAVIFVEIAAFFGSYWVWSRLNREQGKV